MCLPESARLKIERAQEHYDALRSAYYGHLALNPYRTTPVTDGVPPATAAVEIHIQPPLPPLGLIVGDFVHSLRSALDHVAVALCTKNSTSTEFPIFAYDPWAVRDAKQKRDAISSWKQKIGSASPAARAVIKDVQPYHWKENYASHPLWLIHRLDIIDKHRGITVIEPHLETGIEARALRSGDADFLVHGNRVVWRIRDGNRIAYQPVGQDFQPRLATEVGFGWGEGSFVELSRLSQVYEYVRGELAPVLAGVLPSPTPARDLRAQLLYRFKMGAG